MAYMEKDKLVTRDPIGIVIRPDMTMEGQITMLDNPTGYNGKDSSLTIFFADAGVEYKFTGGFSISKQLLSKLLNAAQKIHYMYLWVFFRDEMERRKQAAKSAPAGEGEFPATEDDPFDGAEEE